MTDTQAARTAPSLGERKPDPPLAARRHGRRYVRRLQILLLLADTGLAEGFFLLALAAVESLGGKVGIHSHLSGPLPVLLAILFPVILASRGAYRFGRYRSWRRQAGAGIGAVAWSVGLTAGALFLFAREIPWSLRMVLILYHCLLALWMIALRPWAWGLLQRRVLSAFGPPERVLLVGSDPLALDLAGSMARGRRRTQLLGCADSERPRVPCPHPFFLSALGEVPELAQDLHADLVVLARPDLSREDVVRAGDQLVARGIGVRVAPNVFNQLVDSIPLDHWGGVPLITVGQSPLTPAGERVKRVLDVTGALLGGLLLLPFIIVLAILVKLSSPGPVLYRQLRVGRAGRHFVFYKFRSMRLADDDPVHREYARGLVENGEAAAVDRHGKKIYKLVDDARVTPLGGFLRRTSLDELPQLLNVLRGEMSLVGPRPCMPFEWEVYKDWQKRRLEVTPGMTGLWQVTGRSFVTFEDMVLLDLFYIANWSLVTDLKLILRTIPVVIWGKGGL